MSDSQHDRTGGIVRTIVGRRPRLRGRGRAGIPRGIEVLIKKASLDPAFCQILLEQRAEAAAQIDLELTPAERAILEAVPEAQLVGMIENTRVPDVQRRAFLGQIGAAMLAALAAGCNPPTVLIEKKVGIRPEATPTEVLVEKGLRPEEETQYVIMKETREAATRQAEATATPTPPPEETSTPPPAVTGIRPDPEDQDTPTPRPVSRGIRPDRP